MQTWLQDQESRRVLMGALGVILLWVAAIVLAVVTLTRPFPPPTSLGPAAPPAGPSALPSTMPTVPVSSPTPTGARPGTGPALTGARYPHGELPGDVKDDTAPPSRPAPAPSKPPAPIPTLPPLPVPPVPPLPSPPI